MAIITNPQNGRQNIPNRDDYGDPNSLDPFRNNSYATDTDYANLTAYQPRANPNIQASLNRQVGTAKNYRDNMSSMGDTLYNQYAAQSKRQLADSMKQVDKDFNRRGLLHSGMRQGAQYGTQAAAANDLAGYRQQVNQGLMDNANQLDSNAYNSAGLAAQTGYDFGSTFLSPYETDIEERKAGDARTQNVWNSILGGAGGLAGTIASNRSRTGGTDNSYGGYGATMPNY